MMYKIIDWETGQIIKEYPEQLLFSATAYCDELRFPATVEKIIDGEWFLVHRNERAILEENRLDSLGESL